MEESTFPPPHSGSGPRPRPRPQAPGPRVSGFMWKNDVAPVHNPRGHFHHCDLRHPACSVPPRPGPHGCWGSGSGAHGCWGSGSGAGRVETTRGSPPASGRRGDEPGAPGATPATGRRGGGPRRASTSSGAGATSADAHPHAPRPHAPHPRRRWPVESFAGRPLTPRDPKGPTVPETRP